MNDKVQKGTKGDLALWVIITLLVAGAIGANYYYENITLPIRLMAWLLFTCGMAAIAFQTSQGKKMWQFLLEARMELRKVVWPTRQETVQTTLVVIFFVVVMSLIIWGIDSVLLWAVTFLTGQRG